MRQTIRLIIIGLFLAASASANTDERTWTLSSGETFRAAQISYDSDSGEVLFMMADSEKRIIPILDLSEKDQQWLKGWAEIEKEMDLLVERLGGRFVHEVAEGKYTTDFYVYYPTAFETNKNLPLLILFNAGGDGSGYVKHFAEAAEECGVVVVGCDSFYNTKNDEEDPEMLERFKELLPVIEATVPHNPQRVFMGGNSGGAMRAYNYSAQIDRPWAGIYANAGWLGGYDYYGWSYPSGMRVAMVNGNNDHANRWLERDIKLLESRGSKVVLFSFDGGHQSPSPKTCIKALKWLINEDGTQY